MATLDWRKPHEVHGSGPGKDVVVQGNMLFDRAGNPLGTDLQEIAAKGIPVTRELAVHIATVKAQREAEKKKRLVDEYLEKFKHKIEERINQEGVDILEEDLSSPLDGLEELEAELKSNMAKSSKVRKKRG